MNEIVLNSKTLKCFKNNPLNQNWDKFNFYKIDGNKDINNLDYRKLPTLQNPLNIWNNQQVTLAKKNILIVGRNIQEQVTEELNIHFCSNDEITSQKLKSITDLLTKLDLVVDGDNIVNIFFVTNELTKDYFCLNIKPNINFYYINSKFEDVSVNSKIRKKIQFDHILFDTSVIKFISYASIIRDSWMLLKVGGIVHIPDLLKDEQFFNLQPQLLPRKLKLTILPKNEYQNYYKLKIPQSFNITIEEQKNLLIRHFKKLDRQAGRISKPIKFMIYTGLETSPFEKVYETMEPVFMGKYVEIFDKIINAYRMKKEAEFSGDNIDIYPLYNDNYDKSKRENFYIKVKKIPIEEY